MKELIARIAAAIRFLTIFPVPGPLGHGQSELAGSTPCFPLVGLGLGCVAAFVSWFIWTYFPPFPAAVLLTVLLFGFSGGLHLDGLADTADGFFSARSRDQKLLIMKDSRIGTMGVVALVMVLLTKVAAFSTLGRLDALRAALLVPVAGRCAIVIFMALLPYARPEGGLGSLFYTRRSRWAGCGAFIFFALLSLMVAGRAWMLPILFFLVVLTGFYLLCKRSIGGATGDTLGAVCELGEASVAMAFSFQYWSSR